jgi:hypothetical protein
VLPPEAAEWAREQQAISGVRYVVTTTGGTAADEAPTQARLVLTRPSPNTTYRLSPNVPAENQRIEISALPLYLGDLAEVRFYVDGQILATLDTAPYSILWQLSPGQHAFRAEARDASGQTWSSESVQISVLH